MKICTKCNINKKESDFSFVNKNKLKSRCKNCDKIYAQKYSLEHKKYKQKYDKEYRKKNKIKIIKRKQKWYEDNKENILEKTKQYRKNHKNERKQYLQENKEKLKRDSYTYLNNKRKNNTIFRLKGNVSSLVLFGLKRKNGSKNGKSFFKAIGYTAQQLMDHLMNHPDKEWWMNKHNQGRYIVSKWDDNDPSTWKWQLDHIIPHSEFEYQSMNDPEFKKCWDLSNLRPLNAKQNQLDGVSKKRHNSKYRGSKN